MPFRIEPLDIVIIALIALIIFGPGHLPELGRAIGKTISEFRKGTKEMAEGFHEEVSKPVRSPTPAEAQTAAQVKPDDQADKPGPAAGNFCAHCGTPYPPGARYCNNCGEKITSN
jgi:sec-independent protein translocase protein TatA